MPSNKHPSDKNSTINSDTTPDAETVTTTEEAPTTLLERVQQQKKLRQLSHPDPRSIYKGAKVGIGPNGSRRSMGKR